MLPRLLNILLEPHIYYLPNSYELVSFHVDIKACHSYIQGIRERHTKEYNYCSYLESGLLLIFDPPLQ